MKFILLLLLSFSSIFAAGGSGPFNLSDVINHHLGDSVVIPFQPFGTKVYEGDMNFDSNHSYIFKDGNGKIYHYFGGINMHITKRVFMMWIVSLFLFLVFITAARKIAKNPFKVHSTFTNIVEVFISFLRKDIIDQNMHGHGKSYQHYIFSLFFFVLFCNLFGLIPPVGELLTLFSDKSQGSPFIAKVWSGITVTGDIAVTFSLALITLILIYGTGFAYQGTKYIFHSVPNGVPILLYPLLWPIEFIISPLAKSFALMVRLLANMTAGHVIILALFGFIFELKSYGVVPVAILGTTLIYILEIFVSFLQAYIFVLLTSLFSGLSMHRH